MGILMWQRSIHQRKRCRNGGSYVGWWRILREGFVSLPIFPNDMRLLLCVKPIRFVTFLLQFLQYHSFFLSFSYCNSIGYDYSIYRRWTLGHIWAWAEGILKTNNNSRFGKCYRIWYGSPSNIGYTCIILNWIIDFH